MVQIIQGIVNANGEPEASQRKRMYSLFRIVLFNASMMIAFMDSFTQLAQIERYPGAQYVPF